VAREKRRIRTRRRRKRRDGWKMLHGCDVTQNLVIKVLGEGVSSTVLYRYILCVVDSGLQSWPLDEAGQGPLEIPTATSKSTTLV
jgi:hypothetical protein